MTLRDVYENVLIEMLKENAPNILLEDFNYFLNKAVNNFVNKKYNVYEVSQQITDDLSILRDTQIVKNPTRIADSYGSSKIHTGTYRFELNSNYFHILNCICTYTVKQYYRCYDPNDVFEIGATKLTSDQWNLVTNNFWNKPTYRKPYYYIHFVGDNRGVNSNEDYINSLRHGNVRYGNHQKLFCEVRTGTDNKVFELSLITIDYLKVPNFYRLTQSQIDSIEDSSDIMEFPDYICLEIINELVILIMENVSDPKLSTFPVVSQSIANPAQQLTPQPAALPAQ